jgi:hypothetical protein
MYQAVLYQAVLSGSAIHLRLGQLHARSQNIGRGKTAISDRPRTDPQIRTCRVTAYGSCLSTPFHKYGLVFREDHSPTVVVPIRVARVSKRNRRDKPACSRG